MYEGMIRSTIPVIGTRGQRLKSFSTLNIEYSANVATVTLNRPQSRNAFNATLRGELLDAVRTVSHSDSVRVGILAGSGKGFCAGADLTEQHPADQTVEDRLNQQYKPILVGISESPVIWIAAVQGVAAGIGASLAMSCDLLVMEQDASLYQAFSAVGLIPDGGLSRHLQRHLGKKRAFEVLALGQRLPASECLQYGIANRIANGESALQHARALADELLQRAPLSLQLTKEAMRLSEQASLSEAISIEAKLQLIANRSDDHQEGRRAFIEKRPPRWQGK